MDESTVSRKNYRQYVIVLNNIRFRYPGITLAIISGGLRKSLIPLANYLQINLVYAINCDDNDKQMNNVHTFDKSKILIKWIGENKGSRVIMVGDGVTDLKTKYEANDHITMIGYGEHIVRPRVVKEADYFVYNMLQLEKLILNIFHDKQHRQCTMKT
jgi:soluble P-type ATPase